MLLQNFTNVYYNAIITEKKGVVNMNHNKIHLKDIDFQNLYLGNKIIKLKYRRKEGEFSINPGRDIEYPYYDITLNKEVFSKQGRDIYQSLSDFSNFQDLHRPKSNPSNLHQDFKEVKPFIPMIEGKYYATHLQPLWKFLSTSSSEEEIKQFMQAYNKKLIQQAIKEATLEHTYITEWWYTGGDYYFPEEDVVEIISVKEDNLLSALSSLKGPVKKYEKNLLGKYRIK